MYNDGSSPLTTLRRIQELDPDTLTVRINCLSTEIKLILFSIILSFSLLTVETEEKKPYAEENIIDFKCFICIKKCVSVGE